MNIECVILSAGLSSRMRKNKMIMEIGGKTIIERCVDTFYNFCSRIIVVTGRYHQDVNTRLTSYSKVQFVYNRNYLEGMFSSVKAGIKHVSAQRFFIIPGDYPLIQHSTINDMINTDECFVAPVYEGEQGHPILLDKLFIPLILNSNNSSLRDCLEGSSEKMTPLCVDDIGILKDIDTIEEYRAITGTL